jgi:4-amino-4-deoxychorismate lyase
MRWVYSRGRESGGPPTAFITVGPLAQRVAAVRQEGLAALTLAREMPTTASAARWLLAGAKTLSYAVNMAALRYAAERGAGDVIFVSTDGYVLEGPRSTVVIATGDGLQTPPPTLPILHGTTQQALFTVAAEKGYRCEYRPLRPADLLAAQGIWLVSSITLAARVRTLDGRELPQAPMAAEFSELVDLAIVRDR